MDFPRSSYSQEEQEKEEGNHAVFSIGNRLTSHGMKPSRGRNRRRRWKGLTRLNGVGCSSNLRDTRMNAKLVLSHFYCITFCLLAHCLFGRFFLAFFPLYSGGSDATLANPR